MDFDKIIRTNAESFYRNFKYSMRINTGSEEFKNKLGLSIIDYKDNRNRLIYLYEVDSLIKRDYDTHLKKCKYPDEPEKCPESTFLVTNNLFVEQEIRSLNPSFEFSILMPNIDQELIRKNLIELNDCPEAARHYQSALDKINEGRYDRNILDDLRLSLECLLKCRLNNSKSLENQSQELGKFLKSRNSTTEVRNLFIKQLEHYTNYQNINVKHSEEVKSDEVELIVNLTSSFIKYLNQK